MKRFKYFLILIMLIVLMSSCKSAKDVIVTIGNRNIGTEEFNYYYFQEQIVLLQYKDSVAPQMSEADFLNTVFSGNMTFHDLAKSRAVSRMQNIFILYDLAESNSEFSYNMDDLRSSSEIFKKSFEDYASSLHMTPDDLSKQTYGTSFDRMLLNHELTWKAHKYEQFLYEDIDKKISEEEISSYYMKNRNNYDTATVRHILIASYDTKTGNKYSKEQYDDAKKRAEEIYERVSDGGDMISLAVELSEDPGVTQNQGLYSFKIGDAYLTEFVQWTFSAKPSDIGLVETEAGFHIMMHLGMTGYEDVKEEIRSTLIYNNIMEILDTEKKNEKFKVTYSDMFTEY